MEEPGTDHLRSSQSEPPPAFEIPEEEGQNPIDFDPYIEQLAPSTVKILEDDFHAKFIYVIPKKKVEET